MNLIKISFFIGLIILLSSPVCSETLLVQTKYNYSSRLVFWAVNYSESSITINSFNSTITSNATIFLKDLKALSYYKVQGRLLKHQNEATSGVIYDSQSFIPINYFFDNSFSNDKAITFRKNVSNKKSLKRLKVNKKNISIDELKTDYPQISDDILTANEYTLCFLFDESSNILLTQVYPANKKYWIYSQTPISNSTCIQISND